MVIDARDRRFLVQCATNAMAIEILDHAEPVSTCSTLHGPPNITKLVSGSSGVHGVTLRKSRCAQESLREHRCGANGSARSSVRPISVKFGGDVDVDEISLVKGPGQRRNAVRCFAVHADARRSREVIGQLGSGPCSEASKDVTTNGVKFTGGDSRDSCRDHRVTRTGDDAPGARETLEILVAINRHGQILR